MQIVMSQICPFVLSIFSKKNGGKKKNNASSKLKIFLQKWNQNLFDKKLSWIQ